MFTRFKMWTICPDKRCKRAQACAGNVERCLTERWHPVVPAEWKALLGKFFALAADGFTTQEAAAAAIADMKRHIGAEKRLDQLYPQGVRTPLPAPPAPQPAAAPSPAPERHRGPRIRSL
jgi:hypothetical protein